MKEANYFKETILGNFTNFVKDMNVQVLEIWGCTPITLVLRGLRQEDHIFKTNLGYVANPINVHTAI